MGPRCGRGCTDAERLMSQSNQATKPTDAGATARRSRRAAPRRRLRRRLRAAGPRGGPAPPARPLRAPGRLAGELAEAIESDAALAIAVMRAANNGDGPSGPDRGRARGGRGAEVDCGRARSPQPARDLRRARRPGRRARTATSASAATRSPSAIAAERVGELARLPQRDELAVAALLHDVGKLVLGAALRRRAVATEGRERVARRARPPRAPRARHRPRAGRRRPGPPLGPAADRSPRRSSATTRRTRPATPPRSGSPT